MGALVRALEPTPSLLVLDNCEQVAPDCAHLLNRLLPSCPHLVVVATSRTPLEVSGEQVLTVPPMALTPADPSCGPGEFSSEAVQLFLDRAEMVLPGYSRLGENVQAVDRLCRRLDGSPLAIELAASWIRVLSARELLVEVDRSLESLTSFTPTVVRRHQSLQAVLDSSWHLLEAQDRQVLRQLSVFTGTFSHEAARAVAGAQLPSLLSLAEKSLIHRLAQTASGTRFRLHEVVRSYAADRLASDGVESDHAHVRLFEYVIEVLGRTARADDGALDAGLLDRLHHEQANLKSALEWAVARQDTERALQLAGALWGFFNYATPVSFFTAAVERALALPWDPTSETVRSSRARALYVAAFGAVFGSTLRPAQHRFEEAAGHYRRLGDEAMVAKCLQGWSYSLTLAGAPDKAELLEEQALEIFRRLGDQPGLAWSMHDLGEIAFARADLDRAEWYLKEGRRRFEQTDLAYGSYRAQSLLGDVYRSRADWPKR